MKINLAWKYIAIGMIIVIGTLLLSWQLVRPSWLMKTYGPELKEVILRYVKILGTVEGQSDPSVMAQVATGKSLAYRIQNRCNQCSTAIVVINADANILQVLDYSSVSSEVVARIEIGWHAMSPSSGIVRGICHAHAYTEHFVLVKEDSLWKVADLKDIDSNSVDDSPELRSKYCDSD